MRRRKQDAERRKEGEHIGTEGRKDVRKRSKSRIKRDWKDVIMELGMKYGNTNISLCFFTPCSS